MKQVHSWSILSIRWHRAKLCRHCDLVSGICASLVIRFNWWQQQSVFSCPHLPWINCFTRYFFNFRCGLKPL
jgi:hypothetical protein